MTTKQIFKKLLFSSSIIKNYHYCKLIFGYNVNLRKYCYWFLFGNRKIYWPLGSGSHASPHNVFIGKCSKPGSGGCYLQGRGKLFIGDYAMMGPNISIISGNHGIYNLEELIKKETIIGDYCWIASNSCILAGVVLGKHTIVGAGSVVTKSFPEGYCVIAGNPAKVVKYLDKEKFVEYKMNNEYYGYIPATKFKKYKEKYLGHIEFEYNIPSVSNNEFYKNNDK
jgi:acetyltransferase-like isoleucine patch superfamily enzyme